MLAIDPGNPRLLGRRMEDGEEKERRGVGQVLAAIGLLETREPLEPGMEADEPLAAPDAEPEASGAVFLQASKAEAVPVAVRMEAGKTRREVVAKRPLDGAQPLERVADLLGIHLLADHVGLRQRNRVFDFRTWRRRAFLDFRKYWRGR